MSQRCRNIRVTNYCHHRSVTRHSCFFAIMLSNDFFNPSAQTGQKASRLLQLADSFTRHRIDSLGMTTFRIKHCSLVFKRSARVTSRRPRKQSYRSKGHLAVDVVCRVCPDMPFGMVEPTSNPISARWRRNPPPRSLGQVEGLCVSGAYQHRTHRPSPPYSITSRLVIIFPPCPSTAFLPLRVSDTVTLFSPDSTPRGRGTSTQRRSSDPAHEGGNPGDKSTSSSFSLIDM